MLTFSASAAAQTVTGSIAGAARGKATRGSIVMNIPGGLHVNSNRPASEYAIPTTVSLTGAGVRVGRVPFAAGASDS